jgi:hypothetical protein
MTAHDAGCGTGNVGEDTVERRPTASFRKPPREPLVRLTCIANYDLGMQAQPR